MACVSNSGPVVCSGVSFWSVEMEKDTGVGFSYMDRLFRRYLDGDSGDPIGSERNLTLYRWVYAASDLLCSGVRDAADISIFLSK